MSISKAFEVCTISVPEWFKNIKSPKQQCSRNTYITIIIVVFGLPKDGKCPVVPSNSGGICVQECYEDIDCPNIQLCCSNGCGHTCVMPGTTIIFMHTKPAKRNILRKFLWCDSSIFYISFFSFYRMWHIKERVYKQNSSCNDG